MKLAAVWRQPRLLILLGVNCLLLGTLLGWIAAPPRAQIPPAQPVDLTSVLVGKAQPQAQAGLGDTYGQLIAQPLFHQDRKYTPPPKAEQAATSPPPDFSITGYLEIPGRSPKAFVHERSGAKSVTIAAGDLLDGWTVTSVTAKQVGLRQGQRAVSLVRGGAPVDVSVPSAAASTPNRDAEPISGATPTTTVPAKFSDTPADSEGPKNEKSSSLTTPLQAAPLKENAPPVRSITTVFSVPIQGAEITAPRIRRDTAMEVIPPPLVAPQGPPQMFRQTN